MQIDFYEEYPTLENLAKLKIINFKSNLFLAANSLKEFKILEKRVSKINKNITCCYWPLIKRTYWISPFSDRLEILRIIAETKNIKEEFLVDLEPPP